MKESLKMWILFLIALVFISCVYIYDYFEHTHITRFFNIVERILYPEVSEIVINECGEIKIEVPNKEIERITNLCIYLVEIILFISCVVFLLILYIFNVDRIFKNMIARQRETINNFDNFLVDHLEDFEDYLKLNSSIFEEYHISITRICDSLTKNEEGYAKYIKERNIKVEELNDKVKEINDKYLSKRGKITGAKSKIQDKVLGVVQSTLENLDITMKKVQSRYEENFYGLNFSSNTWPRLKGKLYKEAYIRLKNAFKNLEVGFSDVVALSMMGYINYELFLLTCGGSIDISLDFIRNYSGITFNESLHKILGISNELTFYENDDLKDVISKDKYLDYEKTLERNIQILWEGGLDRQLLSMEVNISENL